MIDPLPSDIFRLGQILNNTYEVTGVLGRGGTGEVYCARNLIVGRMVAIKALSARFSANDDYLELMKREEEMRAISHDAVVRYSECSRTEAGHVFLVMDYIDGPSLSEVMHERRPDLKDLLIIAHRVAEGLVATHARGIVHRDLSPDNVILRGGDAEAAVIIDFGIAKDTAAGARTIVGSSFAGKYEYAAPEQLEGQSDPRADLYALGASILAAWRGEVPFRGATPGEIVRRKQRPLDTEGVPEPLKGVIDKLAAPDPAGRPASAAEAVALIEGALAPPRAIRQPRAGRGRRLWPWLILPAGLAAAVALWFGVEGLLGPPPLPVAEPWTLSAGWNETEAYLAGHAPDEQAATALLAAYRDAAGIEPARLDLAFAQGMPTPDWSARAADLIDLLRSADRWEIALEGMAGSLTALSPSVAARENLETDLREWSATSGIYVSARIAAGPERLSSLEVQQTLDSLATCGPLRQAAAPGSAYALGDTIAVYGSVAAPGDAQRVQQTLASEAGDRTVAADLQILNDELCTVRLVLPAAPPGTAGAANDLSISLSEGATGEPNLSGVFGVDDTPVVDLLLPAALEGYLWVIAVDNTGEAYHILPNIRRTEHRLNELGKVAAGIRRIRVLYSPAEHQADPSRPLLDLEEDLLGKNEIIAIVTRTPLFDELRPGNGESVEALAEALTATLDGREGDILAVASRIIESRE